MDATLFDLDAGEHAKTAGTTAASDAHRVQVWRTDAFATLSRLAATGAPFTADDVIREVGLPDTGVNRNNAVGAVFSAAARQGLIVKTGHYRPSTRAASHARVVAVWVGAS